jgi:hypothetical protein
MLAAFSGVVQPKWHDIPSLQPLASIIKALPLPPE